MKGKTMVIGIVLFVVIVVAGVYFAMMATINKIEKEGNEGAYAIVESVESHAETLTYR